jgi:hypothetical protein
MHSVDVVVPVAVAGEHYLVSVRGPCWGPPCPRPEPDERDESCQARWSREKRRIASGLRRPLPPRMAVVNHDPSNRQAGPCLISTTVLYPRKEEHSLFAR